MRFLACPAKRRTNCSGRRAGKSFSSVVWLVEQWASRPNQSVIFMATSQEHAIKIAWDTVRELNDKFGWGAEYNGTDGTWTWPNGFTFYFMGCKDKRSANYVRGVPKIHRVVVDECGQISDPLLQYLVEDVVEPTLADTDGDLCLTGTPADTGIGFYEDEMARAEAEHAHFCWTAAENPHLEVDGAAFIAERLAKRFAGNANNATFRREYLGHRVQEEGVLVYGPVSAEAFYARPPVDGYTTLGIDVGYHDGFGFTVVRSRAPQPGVHVLAARREPEITLGRAAAIAEQLRVAYDVSEMFVDTAGGGGRTICATLADQYGLPAQPADKRARRTRIELVRGMLMARTITGTRGAADQLFAELNSLPWSLDHTDHREGWQDECADALQYALGGQGFTAIGEWSVEPTDEELYQARVRAVMGGRRKKR